MAAPVPDMRPLIISAPFGNYVQPRGTTATLGTFTLLARPGRVWRILRTVRYYPRLRAWINQIGLRNPGMPWLVERVKQRRIDCSDKIVSVHGFNDADWYTLLDHCSTVAPLAVELNMSCPNVGAIEWPADLFTRAVATGLTVIVKLPPVNFDLLAEHAVDQGVRWFHCCNTLPTPRGGVSGKPLLPVALQCVRTLRRRYGQQGLTLIGGGGITTPADLDAFAAAGADHFAVGTKVMNPRYLFSHAGLTPLIEHARRGSEPIIRA